MSSSPKSANPTSSPSDSSLGSDNQDNYRDIDELDRRSRKLTKLLKKNINRAVKRINILDNVRDKAWLLEDEADLLENQGHSLRNRLKRRSMKRKVIYGVIGLASIGSVYYIWNHRGT